MKLVVIAAFDGREVGSTITDPAAIETILGSDQAQHVVKVTAPDQPAQEAPAADKRRDPKAGGK